MQLLDSRPLPSIQNEGKDQASRLSDLTDIRFLSGTGSGKPPGIAAPLALGYLANTFGGLMLCAKQEERIQREQWSPEASSGK